MTVNLRFRVLAGVLLSILWIGANLACAGSTGRAENASTFSEAFRVMPATIPKPAPLEVLSPPVTTFPSAKPAGATTIPAIAPTIPTRIPPDINRIQTTGTVSPPKYANSMTGQQYRYFERSLEVTALQMELGMRSVDGVYGPQTRKAHIDAIGGPTAAIYRFYPEIGQTPTPCSPAQEPEKTCLPGDGHYELPTLEQLIHQYFKPKHHELAHKIAFCESSAKPHDTGSAEVSSALAIGWFQHLAKYWVQRSEQAGWKDYDPFNGRANVAVAAWLFYDSGIHHWNPSRSCWGAANQPPPTTSSMPPAEA